jgi:hypothetical protein
MECCIMPEYIYFCLISELGVHPFNLWLIIVYEFNYE